MSYALALLVAALLLFVPGVAVLWSGGRRGWSAWGAAPPVSVALVVLAGAVCHLAHLDAVHAPGLVLLVFLTALLAVVARRFRADPDERRDDSPGGRSVPLALLGAAATVGTVVGRAVGSPTGWPQIHDTVFHVGTVTWLVRHGSAWVGDVSLYARRSYPGGWHAVTAVVSGSTGTDAVTASHAVLAVVVTLVWPCGLVLLARRVAGPSTLVGLTAVAAAFLLYGMPFQFLTWGVVWPYLLGMSLVPAVLAALLEVVDRVGRVGVGRRVRGWAVPLEVAVLAVSTAAAAVVHPSVLYGLVLVGGPLAVARLRRAGRPRTALVVAGTALVVAVVAWSASRPESLVEAGAGTGAFGPGDVLVLVLSTVSTNAVAAVVGALLVAVGLRLAVRAGHGWLVPAAVVPLLLAAAVLVLPHRVVAVVTWPWYSDVTRVRAIAVVPSVLAVVLAVVAVRDRWAARRVPSGWLAAPVAALSLLTLLATAPIVTERYHPTTPDGWWATPAERSALRSLSGRLPAGAVLAADPFRGGTFLYLDRDLTLLYPVPDPPPEAPAGTDVVARSLDRVALDPAVCRAAERVGLEYVLTGGDAHPDEVALGDTYSGISRIGSGTKGFTQVARSGPYTLWHVDRCTP